MREAEDRVANLTNGLVEHIDRFGNPFQGLSLLDPGERRLQAKARGEESLDDVVVEITGNALAVADEHHLLAIPS